MSMIGNDGNFARKNGELIAPILHPNFKYLIKWVLFII